MVPLPKNPKFGSPRHTAGSTVDCVVVEEDCKVIELEDAVAVVVVSTHPRPPHAIVFSTATPEGMLSVARLTAPEVVAGKV